MKLFLITLITFLFVGTSLAQDVTIRGQVHDKANGEPMAFEKVKLLNKDSVNDIRQNEIDLEISILEEQDNIDMDGNPVLDEEGNITKALFPASIPNKKITFQLDRLVDIDSGKIINNVKRFNI